MEKLRIFLADDHAVIREGLKMLINAQPDMEVVGEADDGDAALTQVASLRPDVAVIDISMPGTNGVLVTRGLRELCPNVRVIVLTVHRDRVYVRQVMSAGATGYVLKLARPGDFLQAIRTVAGGGIYIHPGVAEVVVETVADAIRRNSDELDRPALTPREIELLQLMAKGYNNKEISTRMEITVKSVETYKVRVMDKLGFRSRVQVIQFALHQGWLHVPDAS